MARKVRRRLTNATFLLLSIRVDLCLSHGLLKYDLILVLVFLVRNGWFVLDFRCSSTRLQIQSKLKVRHFTLDLTFIESS